MDRRTYMKAIATLTAGSLAGCTTDRNTMTQEEAKDVFTHQSELETEELDNIEYAERFVDSELGIVFHAFEPRGTHAGDGAAVTSQQLTDEQLETLEENN